MISVSLVIALKLKHFLERHNPNIASFDLVGKHLTEETAIDLDEIDFF